MYDNLTNQVSYENLTDIEKIDLAYKIFNSVNDSVMRLWRVAWGLGHKQCMSAWEYDKTKMLIERYGYDKVREAFQSAAEHSAFNLAYVNGILTKQTARESADKAEEENRLRKLNLAKQSRQETLPDIEAVKRAFALPEPIKEKKSIDYERAKQEFERDLTNG